MAATDIVNISQYKTGSFTNTELKFGVIVSELNFDVTVEVNPVSVLAKNLMKRLDGFFLRRGCSV